MTVRIAVCVASEATAGVPDNQFRVDDVAFRDITAVKQQEELFNGEFSKVIEGLMYGRQRRRDEAAFIDIIKADERDIFRDPNSPRLQRLERAKRRIVVRRDNGVKFRA